MKKTIVLTLAVLASFGVLMIFGSGYIQNNWQAPIEDDVEISVNSPVENVQQQYKEYKWDYMYNNPNGGLTAEEWNYAGIELSDSVFDFDEAGYKACMMMDKAMPEKNISDSIFYAVLMNAHGFRIDVPVYRFIDNSTVSSKSMLRSSCDIDIYTGKCVQAISGDERIYNAEQIGTYKKYEELTRQQINEILKYAAEKCSAFGYSDFVSYKIRETPGFKISKYWVYIYTQKDELIRVSLVYTDDMIYFESFCNEKMMGYGLDTTGFPDKIPSDIAERYLT